MSIKCVDRCLSCGHNDANISIAPFGPKILCLSCIEVLNDRTKVILGVNPNFNRKAKDKNE